MNEMECWDAVLKRDAAARGRFVYAVLTTGVYCQPGCNARRPRRENVRFFPTPAEAEQAGYRACRRCWRLTGALAEACQVLRGGGALLEAAEKAGLGERRLRGLFRASLGVTPGEYADAARLERFRNGEGKGVLDAAFAAGYASARALYETAGLRLGMTPGRYRRQGEGERIGYTVRNTSLGVLLVAGTARGLSAVRFGPAEDELAAGLRREFSRAEVARDDAGLSEWADALAAHVETQRPLPDLPLDVRATAFQARVWAELRRIPMGKARTYAGVAKALGSPAAYRAVARACATNPVAVAVPCHRVVREDGGLAGYRWGVEIKRALLDREARAAERAAAL